VDDLTAVRRLKRGDMKALGVLVERYQLEAVRTAYLITGDKLLADDVMQEAFLRAYRHIDSFEETRPFVPWFMRIVANTAVKSARKHGREISLEDEGDGLSLLDGLRDPSPQPDESMERSEQQAAVWAALEALSPEQRAVIVLRYYFDYSERELSETLQTPQGTIGWRLHSARKRLRVLLRPLMKLQEDV
jgi:RNA polymerase sigma-70 factor, ECF subfamily